MRKVKSTLVVMVVLLLTELTVGALPEYEIVDLGTLGGPFSYPLGINDAGQVVGTSRTADGTIGRVHGFLWDDVNGMVDMTELLDDSLDFDYIQSAIAINNNGQIVGMANIPIVWEMAKTTDGQQDIGIRPPDLGIPSNRYFLWDSETGFVELPAFDNPYLRIMGDPVRAINDNTQVVGTASGLGSLPFFGLDWSALLWDSINGITVLGTLGGRDGSAFNINTAGKVVGASATGILYENGRLETHAFLWDEANGMIDLGTLDSKNSSAWAINNFDKVVGASVINEPDENGRTVDHAFLWTAAEGMIDIHDSSYTSSIALGINDADQVVGILSSNMSVGHSGGIILFVARAGSPLPSYHSAFLWDKSYGMIDLNDMLEDDSGWDYLESARDINNKGQIIGLGSINGQKHGFLLSPVPPLPVEVDIVPGTLNLTSKGGFTCHIQPPQGHSVADINTESILLEGLIAPTQVWVNKGKSVVMVKFSRADVQDILEAGEVELTIAGELIDETRFEGTDTIRLIDKGSK